MKLILKKIPSDSGLSNNDLVFLTLEAEVVDLYTALQVYEDFLKGAGFIFNGPLGIVEED